MATSAKITFSSFYLRASPYLLMLVCLMLTICLASHIIAHEGTVTDDWGNTRAPEVTIPQGRVRGVNMVTLHNRTVFGFTGIPYAQPPVGDLRFKAPLPASPWKGILKSSITTWCVQINDDGKVVGDEDCLYLSVYTPKLPKKRGSTLLPVIVYLVGGQFQRENASPLIFGPDFLLDKDVVLVIPHFRVGVLGFLTTGDEVSPGNYCLKDIVRALEWNRDNIQYFGGDPKRVTLYGTSTGSMSVVLLGMSDSTEGLYHRTIEESGGALNPSLQEPNEVAKNRAFTLGAYLGCPTHSSTVLVNCLRDLDAELLVNTTAPFNVPDLVPFVGWVAVVEPDVKGAFLTQSPWKIFASGKFRDIPTIYNNARDEGLSITARNCATPLLQLLAAFYVNPDQFVRLLEDIDNILPYMLAYSDSVANVTAFTAALRSYYLNDLRANKSVLLSNLTQVVGDVVFSHPAYRAREQRLALAKSPQYFSSFEHRGVFSMTYLYTHGYTWNIGIAHGEAHIYLFQNHVNLYGPPWYRYSEADSKMVDTMVEMWTSFATNGVPYAPGANGENIWKPYSPSRNYLRIGNGPEIGLEVKYAWYQQRMDFLDELYAHTEWK